MLSIEKETDRSNVSSIRASAYVALAVSIIFNTVALIAIRTVVGELQDLSMEISLGLLWLALTDIWFWVGGLSFVTGMYFWIISLKSIDLSLAYPTSSVSYVIIAVISYYVFQEPVTIARIVGMFLVIGGVVLLFEHQGRSSQ
jgi:multidrug transporter EmrE-like cation transporter